MKVSSFVDEERDLLIMLLCLTGVKLSVPMSDPGQPRLKISSHDLAEREISEISLYSKDLELISNRLETLGYSEIDTVDDRTYFRKDEKLVTLFEVGDLVQLRTDWGQTPAGSICYIYNKFAAGCCLISEVGVNLYTFSQSEQHKYLILIKKSDFKYKFKNVVHLANDYDYGMFDKSFQI